MALSSRVQSGSRSSPSAISASVSRVSPLIAHSRKDRVNQTGSKAKCQPPYGARQPEGIPATSARRPRLGEFLLTEYPEQRELLGGVRAGLRGVDDQGLLAAGVQQHLAGQ